MKNYRITKIITLIHGNGQGTIYDVDIVTSNIEFTRDEWLIKLQDLHTEIIDDILFYYEPAERKILKSL